MLFHASIPAFLILFLTFNMLLFNTLLLLIRIHLYLLSTLNSLHFGEAISIFSLYIVTLVMFFFFLKSCFHHLIKIAVHVMLLFYLRFMIQSLLSSFFSFSLCSNFIAHTHIYAQRKNGTHSEKTAHTLTSGLNFLPHTMCHIYKHGATLTEGPITFRTSEVCAEYSKI